ncbi:MAG: family 78 glycoside hydrolase catalytic domain [Planctomycetota bacterium]
MQPIEVGPRRREDFTGLWIGPTENRRCTPLPEMGRWIKPTDSGQAGDLQRLTITFDLNEGFPRCVGVCWLAADPACQVVLNGEALAAEGQAQSIDRLGFINLPWDKLRAGNNTLSVVGPAEKLASGISCMARIWQAEGGYTVLQSDSHWTSDGQDASVIDRPVPAGPIDNGRRRSIELKRNFQLDCDCPDARLYVTALGIYELSINGKRVGEDVFAPGWTDTDCRLHYAAHDVTGYLVRGDNEVTARIGNGWWSSGMGWEHRGIAAKPSQTLRLLMDLVAYSDSGQKQALASSDDAWQWRPSEVIDDSFYHGQTADYCAAREPWRPVAVLEDGFDPLIEPGLGEPIRVTDELTAVELSLLPTGAYLYDFGQNHSGRPRLRTELPEGTTVRVRHCEVLDDNGQPYFENYRTAAATDTLVAKGGTVDWSPEFTYRGYRYAVLSGLPAGVEPDKTTLTSQLLHNDVKHASTFSCSNPLLNQIDQLVRWGLRTNLHSVPTDCPQRDERLGWTGDVQLIAPTSCWMFNLHGFYTKWLQDLVDAQRSDGGITHIAPFTPVLANESAPIWGDVITVLPEVLHHFYDDPALLEKLFEPMKKWVGWYEAQSDNGLAAIGGFGDWVALEETPPELCGTAYFAHSSRIVSRIAALLGREEEAERYRKQAQLAADAFHRAYFDQAAGHYQPNTQTAQLLSLAFDLAPQPLRQPIADHLATLVEKRGDKPATGFVGTALLLPVLTRFGYHELAYRVLNTRSFPSLGYMIDQGSTTVWERWNTDKEGPAMNSRNHFCLGAMAQWLYEELVGIKPDAELAGFRKILLEPKPAGDLSFADLRYESPQGPIAVRWQLDEGKLVYEADLPANVSAELRLPSSDPVATVVQGNNEKSTDFPELISSMRAGYRLGPGKHRFVTPAHLPEFAATER